MNSSDSSYDKSKFRAPKKRKGALYAANIGFRAPEETRRRTGALVKVLNYSANRVVIEAVDAIYDQIFSGLNFTPDIILRGRRLKDIV